MSALLFAPATAAPDAGPDIAKQTALTLARLDKRLRADRSSLADAVAITVYLRRASDFAAMNEEYRQAWKATPPTRTTVVTEPVTSGALVEMSATAAAAGADRRAVHPLSWMPSPNPYSYAIRSGETLFLSGLIPRNARSNTTIAGDVGVQSRAVLDNARDLLDAAGLSLAHIVSARVFLPEVSDFDEMNRVYGEYFTQAPPARATVGASLTGGYKVEMTFVASAGSRRPIDAVASPAPNVSAAVAADDLVFVSGLLAPAPLGDPAAETHAILDRLDSILSAAGSSRGRIRDLIVYAATPAAAATAAAICRTAAGHTATITPVHVALVPPQATVEIVTVAERA